MEYKVVYVLTVDNNLHFLDELFLSLKSLKYYNPHINVEIVCDVDTLKNIESSVEKYEFVNKNANFVIVDVPNSFNSACKSRYIKTNLRNLISGDYLYIDLDTIICDRLPNIISKKDFGMVLDENKVFSYEDFKQARAEDYNGVGIEILPLKYYFNSGVIWTKDKKEMHEFYLKWFNAWNQSNKKGYNYKDQPSLNNIIYKENIDVDILDDSLNCQVGFRSFPLDVISRSIVIHYFNSKTNHLQFSKEDFSDIDYDKIVKHPREIFNRVYAIDYDANKEFIESEVYYHAYNVFYNHKKLFSFLNYILPFLKNSRINMLRKRILKLDK